MSQKPNKEKKRLYVHAKSIYKPRKKFCVQEVTNIPVGNLVRDDGLAVDIPKVDVKVRLDYPHLVDTGKANITAYKGTGITSPYSVPDNSAELPLVFTARDTVQVQTDVPEIQLVRKTSTEHTFRSALGSSFNADNVDAQNTQLLHIAQEIIGGITAFKPFTPSKPSVEPEKPIPTPPINKDAFEVNTLYFYNDDVINYLSGSSATFKDAFTLHDTPSTNGIIFADNSKNTADNLSMSEQEFKEYSELMQKLLAIGVVLDDGNVRYMTNACKPLPSMSAEKRAIIESKPISGSDIVGYPNVYRLPKNTSDSYGVSLSDATLLWGFSGLTADSTLYVNTNSTISSYTSTLDGCWCLPIEKLFEGKAAVSSYPGIDTDKILFYKYIGGYSIWLTTKGLDVPSGVQRLDESSISLNKKDIRLGSSVFLFSNYKTGELTPNSSAETSCPIYISDTTKAKITGKDIPDTLSYGLTCVMDYLGRSISTHKGVVINLKAKDITPWPTVKVTACTNTFIYYSRIIDPDNIPDLLKDIEFVSREDMLDRYSKVVLSYSQGFNNSPYYWLTTLYNGYRTVHSEPVAYLKEGSPYISWADFSSDRDRVDTLNSEDPTDSFGKHGLYLDDYIRDFIIPVDTDNIPGGWINRHNVRNLEDYPIVTITGNQEVFKQVQCLTEEEAAEYTKSTGIVLDKYILNPAEFQWATE